MIIIVQEPMKGISIEAVKSNVTGTNRDILLGNYKLGAPVPELIGDVDSAFSANICEMLAEAGVLVQHPILDADGNPVKSGKEQLFTYTWGENPFESLSEEKIDLVAWDLRLHRNFCHISVVKELRIRTLSQNTDENALDESEPEEYDSSINDDSTESPTNEEENT